MSDALFDPEQLREDMEVEAKRAVGQDGRGELPKSAFETYAAFANTEGGMILLGVSEEKDGKLVATGLLDPEKVIQDFWNQINNRQKVSRNLLTDKDVQRHSLTNGRWAVTIQVPRASRQDRPVFINGNPLTGTYKRRHSGDFHCTEEEVRRMLAEQTEDARDARLLEDYTFDDLEMDTFKAYRARLAALKPDHPFNSAEPREFLRKIGGWAVDRASGKQGLTAAGLLMFGRQESIQEVFPNYFLDYRELPVSGSKTQWVDRLTPDGTWSGNLFDFYRLSIQRLFRDLKVPFILEGDSREDDTPIHKALREALVNALVHADYSARISVLAVKAPDYFGFRNPGKMRIPISKALEGGNSDCRNRNLQKMFSLIGLGEQAGSGIPRVIENWKSQHYRLPELWESDEPEATLMRLRTVSLLPDGTLRDLHDQFGAEFERLDENGRLTLATAQIERFVTNARLQQLLRLHPRDITLMLRGLVDGGFLVTDGQGRATTYRVSGSEAVDLAQEASLEVAPVAGSGGTSDGFGARSDGTSDGTSDGSSLEIPFSRTAAGQILPPELWSLAGTVRSRKKAPSAQLREIILILCADRFLNLQELSQILNRTPNDLRQRYIRPMFDEGLLERRYPTQPNHEQQAYRTKQPADT